MKCAFFWINILIFSFKVFYIFLTVAFFFKMKVVYTVMERYVLQGEIRIRYQKIKN